MGNALPVCDDVYLWILLMETAFDRSISGYCRCHFPGGHSSSRTGCEEVEQQITIPLERAINGLPGMHVMRSKSTFGLSMIPLSLRTGQRTTGAASAYRKD